MESTRRFTTDEVSAIVRRALDGRDAADTVSHEELLETARELGIDPHRLEQAIEEQDALGEIEEAREAWRRRRKQHFVHGHLRSYLIVNGFLMVLDLLTSGGEWFYYPMLGWGIGLAFDAASAFFPSEQSVERGARKLLRAHGRLRETPRGRRNRDSMEVDHGRREERYSS